MEVLFVWACMKVSTASLKLDGCILVSTLLLSQSDDGDKLGYTILCAGGEMEL